MAEPNENDRAEQARERVRQALERFWARVRGGKGPREKRPGAWKRGGR